MPYIPQEKGFHLYHPFAKKKRNWRKTNCSDHSEISVLQDVADNSILTSDLKRNLSIFEKLISPSKDIVIRDLSIGKDRPKQAAILFVNNMVNQEIINRDIIRPLITSTVPAAVLDNPDFISTSLLPVANVEKKQDLNSLLHSCYSGNTILLIDGMENALVIDTQGLKQRAVEDSKIEPLVRGPREAFTESLGTNITLVRRRIKNPKLTLEMLQLGQQSKTDLCILYVKGIINPNLVQEIRRRLARINTDAILESGYIEQFIEDEPYSIFPTIGNSERPDTITAKMLEGRAAILVDGTPIALTMPMTFFEGFQSPEDYYSRPYLTSLIRLLRFSSFCISVYTPALYTALTTFHQEMIPTPLLLKIAATREGIPFPVALEMLLMGAIFEILREAGVRLPRPVGQTISIVGALVLGEAAASAGLISPLTIILTALTAVTGFMVPTHTDSTIILRVIFLLLASVLGGLGITLGLLFLIPYLNSLRSFGTPYMYPLATFSLNGFKDFLIRAPIWAQSLRPSAIVRKNRLRQGAQLKPTPPSKRKE
jgi:spore germination protein KA